MKLITILADSLGSSSGAAMATDLKFIATLKTGGNIVTLFPDRRDRYFSKGLYA